METVQDSKSGQEVAKQSGQAKPNRFHVDHWKKRLFKKAYTRSGQHLEVDEWSVRLQHLGRRDTFALSTANASVAAAKAKEIFTFLEANNWDATLAKFKPKPVEKLEVATLGEFIAAINESGYFQPRTARIYATKFRKLMSDLSDAEAGMKTKQRRSKYDYVNGGRAAWLAKLGAQSLDVLTPESINEWRNAYVAKADADPVKRKASDSSN